MRATGVHLDLAMDEERHHGTRKADPATKRNRHWRGRRICNERRGTELQTIFTSPCLPLFPLRFGQRWAQVSRKHRWLPCGGTVVKEDVLLHRRGVWFGCPEIWHFCRSSKRSNMINLIFHCETTTKKAPETRPNPLPYTATLRLQRSVAVCLWIMATWGLNLRKACSNVADRNIYQALNHFLFFLFLY